MTTRVLVIIRHGKAEQSETKPDIDRSLTERGHTDARLGGEWLASRGIAPDVVLSSPSQRTRQTWHEVAIGMADGGSEASPTVVYDADLYSAGMAAAFSAIRGVDPDAKTVLLIGHNPTVSALSHRLDDTATRALAGLRTSEIAVHAVTVPWADLATADLTTIHLPRA
jgi:phosphohistidine phosphatase